MNVAFRPSCNNTKQQQLNVTFILRYWLWPIRVINYTLYTYIHTTVLQPSEPCPGLPGWAGTRTNLEFSEARDSEWQWHQLGHMQTCTLPQITIPAPHQFLQAGCPSCCQTNSVKAQNFSGCHRICQVFEKQSILQTGWSSSQACASLLFPQFPTDSSFLHLHFDGNFHRPLDNLLHNLWLYLLHVVGRHISLLPVSSPSTPPVVVRFLYQLKLLHVPYTTH